VTRKSPSVSLCFSCATTENITIKVLEETKELIIREGAAKIHILTELR
jgi:hypothetical protein